MNLVEGFFLLVFYTISATRFNGAFYNEPLWTQLLSISDHSECAFK